MTPSPAGPPYQRVLADLSRGDGPLLVCVGGVHGNEPAGIHAALRVARTLDTLHNWQGRFVALVGNLAASNANDPTLRYFEHDLNRACTADKVAAARSADPSSLDAEQRELLELTSLLQHLTRPDPGRATLLDLHTVSSPSPAFVYAEDSLPARRLGLCLGLPLVLGFEEEVEGLLADYATSALGVLSLLVEAGTHTDPDSVLVHEAAIWTVLQQQGLVPDAATAAGFDTKQRLRLAAGRQAGRVFDIRQRAAVGSPPLDMLDSAQAFTRVWKGWTTVATRVRPDRTDLVRAPADGLLFMPNRQARKRPTDDAFFVLRPVWRRFMWCSARLRRSPAVFRLLGMMPGVRRIDNRTMHVDPTVAAFMSRDIFHLLGFRIHRAGPIRYHRPLARAAMACVALPRALVRVFRHASPESGDVWVVRRRRLDVEPSPSP